MFLTKIFNKKNIEEKIYKIVLIGECKSGKTQFLNKYLFDYDNNIYTPTIGSDNYSKSYFLNNYNKKYILEFYDVGGKERYNDLIPLYTRNSDFILIFYNVNKIKSYDYAKYLYENYINKKSNIIFVGNYNNDKSKINSYKNNIYNVFINTENNDNLNIIIDTILLDIRYI